MLNIKNLRLLLVCLAVMPGVTIAQDLSGLSRVKPNQTRSISPENFTGAKGEGGKAITGTGAGAARELGRGWKISPSVNIKAHSTFTLAEITGPATINHIWMTPTGNWRNEILRFYWDDETEPSIEVPVGDFFCMGWGKYAPLSSLPVCVNPGSAFNCYWAMPFHKKCRITLENIGTRDMVLYYQVDYELGEVAKDAGYFHAQFRRQNPLQNKKDYVLVDSIKGKGQYVGTYMAVGVHNNGWWGEGEIKFFIDGDKQYPTICGTGTEDYFCGSYNFDAPGSNGTQYTPFCTPYAGLAQVIRGDGHYDVQQRFGLYRWHITDPIRFEQGLKVTIQALGWRSEGRYLPLAGDFASTVFWYQQGPHNPYPKLPAIDQLEIN